MTTATGTVVTVRAGLLKNALQRIAHISRTKIEEASSHLLLEVKDDTLTATATDLDCWASIEVPVEHQGDPAALCVPTSVLVGLVAKARKDLVQLEIFPGSHLLVHAGGEYRIQGLHGDDYPLPREPEDWTAWTMDAAKLREALDFVYWCRSTETGRPTLHGVYLDTPAGAVVATSGYVAGLVSDVCEPQASAPTANIPPSVVSHLLKALQEGPAEIHVSTNMVRIVNDGCRLTFRLLDGQFPRYDQVIPKEHTFEALVDRRQLLEAVGRAELFVGPGIAAASDVVLTWSDGGLVLRSESQDRGNQEEAIETETDGELRIKFAVGYLKSALSRLEADQVRVRGTAMERATLFDDGPESDRFYLLMPRRIVD